MKQKSELWFEEIHSNLLGAKTNPIKLIFQIWL